MLMGMVHRMIAEEPTERQRQAMTAAVIGGMPLEEVARRMGTNRNALYKLLHDARQRLQKRMMARGLSTLKRMVRNVLTTRPDEIGCDECFEQLDLFVEMTLAGKNAAEAMPLVQDHLERCRDCREEFEGLLTALQALT